MPGGFHPLRTSLEVRVFTVRVHNRTGDSRDPFPERRRSEEQVLARLTDLPRWTDSVLVFDEVSGRQVVLAFVNRPQSQRANRVVLDMLVVPERWREHLGNVHVTRRPVARAGPIAPAAHGERQCVPGVLFR
jgi:hypothetical protein